MPIPRLSLPMALGLSLAIFAGPALAGSCVDAVSQSDMNECARQDWQAKDADLNAAYKAAMQLLKQWDKDLPKAEQGGADSLKAAQRAWIAYRDAACTAEGFAMRGGSAEPLLVYGCMARLTESRTQDLQALVENYGVY